MVVLVGCCVHDVLVVFMSIHHDVFHDVLVEQQLIVSLVFESS